VTDELDAKSPRVSRRSALKAAGVGTVVVWTAPVIDSVVSRAAASSALPSVCTDGFHFCAGPDPGEGCQGDVGCFCIALEQGGFACIQHGSDCGTNQGCTTNADCPTGSVCYASGTCFDSSYCRPLCPEGASRVRPAVEFSGKDPLLTPA